MSLETQLKHLRQEIKQELQDLRKLIIGKNLVGNWVKQPIACAMLNVQYRQLARIRIHVKDGVKVGTIRWRKGAGRTVEYYKPDIEKHLNKITIQ